MRIVVLGSGVIGIASANYLAIAGHEVTVIDRQPGPAMETSFANAGQISTGNASLFEPALDRIREKLFGTLRRQNDETGDCHLFSTRLTKMAKSLGVQFRYNVEIDGLALSGNAIDGIRCGAEIVKADIYVVAMGAHSTIFQQSILKLPVYPMKGYRRDRFH